MDLLVVWYCGIKKPQLLPRQRGRPDLTVTGQLRLLSNSKPFHPALRQERRKRGNRHKKARISVGAVSRSLFWYLQHNTIYHDYQAVFNQKL
jgi:hypothetical protein